MGAPSLTELMIEHDIDRIVYVRASDLLPRAEFHAWPRGVFMSEGIGIGPTAEDAVHDAAAKLTRKAA